MAYLVDNLSGLATAALRLRGGDVGGTRPLGLHPARPAQAAVAQATQAPGVAPALAADRLAIVGGAASAHRLTRGKVAGEGRSAARASARARACARVVGEGARVGELTAALAALVRAGGGSGVQLSFGGPPYRIPRDFFGRGRRRLAPSAAGCRRRHDVARFVDRLDHRAARVDGRAGPAVNRDDPVAALGVDDRAVAPLARAGAQVTDARTDAKGCRLVRLDTMRHPVRAFEGGGLLLLLAVVVLVVLAIVVDVDDVGQVLAANQPVEGRMRTERGIRQFGEPLLVLPAFEVEGIRLAKLTTLPNLLLERRRGPSDERAEVDLLRRCAALPAGLLAGGGQLMQPVVVIEQSAPKGVAQLTPLGVVYIPVVIILLAALLADAAQRPFGARPAVRAPPSGLACGRRAWLGCGRRLARRRGRHGHILLARERRKEEHLVIIRLYRPRRRALPTLVTLVALLQQRRRGHLVAPDGHVIEHAERGCPDGVLTAPVLILHEQVRGGGVSAMARVFCEHAVHAPRARANVAAQPRVARAAHTQAVAGAAAVVEHTQRVVHRREGCSDERLRRVSLLVLFGSRRPT